MNSLGWIDNMMSDNNQQPPTYGQYKVRSKWAVLEDDLVIHVVPETDIKPHGIRKGNELSVEVADMNCPCKPKIDMSREKTLVVHNSFEDTEFLDKLLANPPTEAK